MQPNSYVSTAVTTVPGKKYWVNVPLTSFNSSTLLFNKAKWDTLPPVAHQIFYDAFTFYTGLVPITTAIGFKKFGDLIRNGEIEAIAVDQEVKDLISAHQQKEFDALVSIAPKTVADPQGFVAQYKGLVDKWTRIIREELAYPGERENVADMNAVINDWYTDYDFTPYAERLKQEITKARAEQ